MLQRLSIRNYALIDELEVDFSHHFTIITGETGAGKSILLGALGLVAGNRADSAVLHDKAGKCVVEAAFDVAALSLQPLFEANDLDYDPATIIRREILPNGKSRAFVNDTPVSLTLLKALAERLIDIHSQHETLLLRDAQFQLQVVDAYAGNARLLEAMAAAYRDYRRQAARLEELRAEEMRMKSEYDFHLFQFEELEKAGLQPGELESLEGELKKLSLGGELKSSLQSMLHELSESESSILPRLNQLRTQLAKLADISPELKALQERLQATHIELKDIAATLHDQAEEAEVQPERQQWVEDRLDMLYTLLKKHRMQQVEELIQLRTQLDEKLNAAQSMELSIAEAEKQLLALENQMKHVAADLHDARTNASAPLEKDLLSTLKHLAMPDVQVQIQIREAEEYSGSGSDRIAILFSANKGAPLLELARIASGGEVSRFMLAVKAVIAGRTSLPTLVLDEIDTGVSGAVADKLGIVMQRMARNQQLIAITHLPQIASKGDAHWKVVKSEKNGRTISGIVQLTPEQRVEELAVMLSGSSITREAIENARVLLGYQ